MKRIFTLAGMVFFLSVFFISCSKESVQQPAEPTVQPIDADTLFFNNETQFRDFLYAHNLAKKYTIVPPKFNNNCAVLPAASIYPSQRGSSKPGFLQCQRVLHQPANRPGGLF